MDNSITDVQKLSTLMAQRIGHGMPERCEKHAKVAVDYYTFQEQALMARINELDMVAKTNQKLKDKNEQLEVNNTFINNVNKLLYTKMDVTQYLLNRLIKEVTASNTTFHVSNQLLSLTQAYFDGDLDFIKDNKEVDYANN